MHASTWALLHGGRIGGGPFTPPAHERLPAPYAGGVTVKTVGMGFDPNRRYQRRPSDYVMVGAAVLVVVALLLWALLA
jgi:hypothetical protein